MSCTKPNCNCPQIYADRTGQDVDQLKHGYPCLQSDHDSIKLKQVPENSAPSEMLPKEAYDVLEKVLRKGEAPNEETKEEVSTEFLINESITAASKILLMAFYACDLKEGITGSIVNDHDNKLFLLEFNKLPQEGGRKEFTRSQVREEIRKALDKGVEIGFDWTAPNYHSTGTPSLDYVKSEKYKEDYLKQSGF